MRRFTHTIYLCIALKRKKVPNEHGALKTLSVFFYVCVYTPIAHYCNTHKKRMGIRRRRQDFHFFLLVRVKKSVSDGWN
jgi:hypothetical protein